MARLDGRVAIVTGAGRGLGREHALRLAQEGAKVVVNDLGGSVHGEGADDTPAQQVVKEIEALGGAAAASAHNVADWQQAKEMVELAVETFGDLHVLVNNAGILRDKTLANMDEAEWDAVINVHLKGHAAPTRHAVAYWKDRAKAGEPVNASVIMTSSIAGLAGNFGQANYSSVKLAVLALSQVVHLEYGRYGVRSNAVSPGGRTRLSLSVPGAEDAPEPPPDEFDPSDPAHVSPLIAWLAAGDCPASGQVFHITGDHLVISRMPPIVDERELGRQWALEDLDEWVTPRLVEPPQIADWIPAARGGQG
ncbi:MAG TPA: SDR family NAD(P)-dependent oxidoreductase [Nitriliruptorales bacterium]